MGRVRCGAMSIHNLPEAFAEIQVSPTCTGDVKTCYALAIRGRPAEDCTMCKKVHVCLHAETRNREKMVKQTHLKGNVRVPLAANRSRYPLTIIHLVFFHSRCCGGVRLFSSITVRQGYAQLSSTWEKHTILFRSFVLI